MVNKLKAFNILTVFIVVLFSASVYANSIHGILMVVKGDVEIQQKEKVTRAKVGAKVYPGDVIVTKKDARAKLVMVDKNIINISPESKFLLEKYEYNPEENKKGALLNVIYGKVRTTVNQKYDGEKNKFQVKTKSSVAGVRGTDFLVSFNKTTNTSKVVTFEGRVEVGSGVDAAGRIMNPVSVTPGQYTVAAIGTPPSAPITMPQSEMNALSEQSVADSPADEGKDKERTPSNKEGEKENNGNNGENGNNGNSGNNDGDKPREPGSVGTVAPPPPPADVMDQMGEDVSAPVVSDTNQMLPPPIVPISTQPLAGTEPLMPPMDPTLPQGKANVIIHLVP